MAIRRVFCIMRYGEIALKGSNRGLFEKKLVENLKSTLGKDGYKTIARVFGRILTYTGDIDFDVNNKVTISKANKEILTYKEKYSVLKTIPGAVSYSIAVECVPELKDLYEIIDLLLFDKKFDTFRITTQRIDKIHNPSSYYNNELGSYVISKYGKKAKMKDSDLNIHVEMIAGQAYVFLDKVQCIGGLPLGIEGIVLAEVNDKKDLLAAVLMMKRGCKVVFFGKATKFKEIILKFDPNPKIINSPDEIEGIISIVVGETVADINERNDFVVFRPLIGFSKEEIDKMIKELL